MKNLKASMGGFSLVELMIGVLIAIIASIVMFQVFAFSERQKRVTTGASDAQINGALALDSMEREIRMAGFGLTNSLLADCNPATTYSYNDPGSGAVTGGLGAITQPVSITQGSGADTLRILVSASDFGSNYTSPGQICLRSNMPQSSSELNVISTHGCTENNLAVLVQGQSVGSSAGGSCTIMQITGVQSSSLKIQHNPGKGPDGINYNPSAAVQNDLGWPAYSVSASGCEAYLVCLGSLVDALGTTFTVDPITRELRRDGVPIASGIMDMQAQYGLVSGASGTLSTWQEPTDEWAAPTPPATLTQTQVRQIKAIRVALIARSGEYEKPTNATNTCDTTTTTSGLSSWATFDTANWPSDWKCYRYKVFETVIPLRNVIWSAT